MHDDGVYGIGVAVQTQELAPRVVNVRLAYNCHESANHENN